MCEVPTMKDKLDMLLAFGEQLQATHTGLEELHSLIEERGPIAKGVACSITRLEEAMMWLEAAAMEVDQAIILANHQEPVQ